MRKKLLNQYEEITHERLKEICGKDEVHIYPKVRLADIFSIKNSGISNIEYTYSLKSHFDFTIFDKEYEPLFSVEYDGKYHDQNETQKQNDRLKNRLCERFDHPLLRINSNYLSKKFRQIDLLTYFIDAWFHGKAFHKAQKEGSIPADEPFDLQFIFSNGERRWPYWFSIDAQNFIRECFKKDIVDKPGVSNWVGKDKEGNYYCIGWLEIDSNNCLYSYSGMQNQFFPYVYPSELLGMIVTYDLGRKLKSYLAEESKAINRNKLEKLVSNYQNKYKRVAISSCGSSIV